MVFYPLLLIVGRSHFIYRSIKEHQLYGLRASLGESVMIICLDQNAILLAKELNHTNDLLELAGTQILGLINQLSELKRKI